MKIKSIPKFFSWDSVTLFITLTLAVSYYAFILKYTPHFPHSDDYTIILETLNKYQSGGINVTRDFFNFSGGHCHFNTKFISWIYYIIFNEFSFKAVTFIGNLPIVLICTIIFLKVSNKTCGNFRLLTCALLLFNYYHWQASLWATGSTQLYWVTFFSFMSIINFNSNKKFSVFFIFLAILSDGRGWALLATYFIYFLNQKEVFTKSVEKCKNSQLIFFVFFTSLTLVLYFYEKSIDILLFFFRLLGNFILHEQVGLIWGGMFFLILINETYKGLFKNNKDAFYLLIFLILSTMMISIGRSEMGRFQPFESRYSFYSIIIFAIFFLAMVEKYKLKQVFIIFPIAFCAFSVFLLYNHNVINKHSVDEYKLWKGGNWRYLHYSDKERANKILLESLENGVFKVK